MNSNETILKLSFFFIFFSSPYPKRIIRTNGKYQILKRDTCSVRGWRNIELDIFLRVRLSFLTCHSLELQKYRADAPSPEFDPANYLEKKKKKKKEKKRKIWRLGSSFNPRSELKLEQQHQQQQQRLSLPIKKTKNWKKKKKPKKQTTKKKKQKKKKFKKKKKKPRLSILQ